MIRKIFLALVPVFLLLLISSQQSQASAAKSYRADEFDVSAAIASGGTMDVTETVTFHFTGGPFTLITQQLPTDNTDGISIISAGMDNQTMNEGTSKGQYEVISGDNLITIGWYFPSTSDSTHTFILKYHIQGIIQKSSTDSTDLLNWIPLPTSHDYTIGTSVVTITYPSSTALVRNPEIANWNATVSQSAGRIQFKSTDLMTDESLAIGLRFRPGSLISVPPKWQQIQLLYGALYLYSLAGTMAIFVLGSLFFILHYRRRNSVRLPASRQITAPPTDFPPAIAGALVRTWDGSPDRNHALGTLLDLINREIVTVVPPLKGGWGSWLSGRPDFQLTLVRLPNDLHLHEAALLKMLFNTEVFNTEEGVKPKVDISDLSRMYIFQSNFQSDPFSKALKQDMAALGLFDSKRQGMRKRLGWISFLMLFVSVLSLISLFVLAVQGLILWSLVLLPLGLLGMGITARIRWVAFSPYADKTVRIKAQWGAFLQFMRRITKARRPDIAPPLFAQYLPYAASFSLLVPWAWALQRQGMIALPDWFRGLVIGDNPDSSGDQMMGAFVGMIETTHEQTHPVAKGKSTLSSFEDILEGKRVNHQERGKQP